jgi:zinc protease
MLRAALTSPRFEPDAIERVRGQFIASLSQQAHNPRSLSDRMWMRDAFEDHVYGGNVNGSVRSVAAITREDLVGFAGRRLRSTGLVIGAVGDITPAELTAPIDRIFGGLPGGGEDPPVAETKPTDNGGVLINRQAAPQSAVTFGQVGPKRGDPDWYTARLVNDVLGGGGFRGRLMREIREKRGLAYGVSTELVSFRHAGVILGVVATENARVAESIALIRAEWQRMRDEGPSKAELNLAKDFLIGSFPLNLDTSAHVASVLVEIQLEKLGIDYLDRRAALFGAVTLDQAKKVARALLDPERLSFAVVGDPADLTATRVPPEAGFQ